MAIRDIALNLADFKYREPTKAEIERLIEVARAGLKVRSYFNTYYPTSLVFKELINTLEGIDNYDPEFDPAA